MYNQNVYNWDYPEKLFQFRIELRGCNVQRSAMHIWVDRNISIWYGCDDDPPPGYDLYVYMERKFLRRYNRPACATVIPQLIKIGQEAQRAREKNKKDIKKKKNKQKKLKQLKKFEHQKRKLQVWPFQAGLLEIEIFNYRDYDALILRIVRYTAQPRGPLYMPVHVIREITASVHMGNASHRDTTYINYQRGISAMWTIVLNIINPHN